MMLRWWRRKRRSVEIEPDEIFIDSSNLPAFDTDQFEGRIERPIKRSTFFLAGGLIALLFFVYLGRAWDLTFINGVAYAKQAAENQLTEQVIFADRGIIADRTGKELAFNARLSTSTSEFAERVYADLRGVAHVVGYVKSPAKDSFGVYYRDSFVGIDGAERAFDDALEGQNGLMLAETDAHGKVISQSTERPPIPGQKITLSIDATVTQGLFDAIAARAQDSKFQGGAGVIMDVQTGEIIALTSYPEYSPEALMSGDANVLAGFLKDTRQPFLNRVTDGLYAPGSIVKPFVAVAALTEGVVDESTKILSTGSISVPNPYDPAHPSVFKDWRPQGWVNVRDAIAVSSDVYFYEVGGGYQSQKGLGIDNIDKYLRLFGLAATRA